MTSLTIGGIVSGLDTNSIIDKLVAVEGNSQTLLTKQQTAQKSAVTAYSALLGSIGALATQVSALGNTSTWATTTASSSVSSVSATSTGNQATALTFSVDAVAAAHTLVSATSLNALTATAASSGSLTLTKNDGTVTDIAVGNGSLAEVVAGINGANVGLAASAVQTSPGSYRLQISATSTGAASQFTMDGLDGFATDPTANMVILAKGTDAQVTIGTDTTAGSTNTNYTATSATNTFSDVAPGISFTVSKKEDAVTVSSTVDPTAVATQIGSIVTNINNLLASIASNTAWDPTTKTGGPLVGDSTVRSLQQSLLSTVSSLNTAGISVSSAGQITFDSAAFTTAFMADPTGVMKSYGASSTFTATTGVKGSASYVNSVPTTAPGSYAVTVTSNAKAEQWQVVPPGTGIVGRTMTLTRGTTSVSYQAVASDPSDASDPDSLKANAAALNLKLAQSGFGVTASVGTVAAADGSGTLVPAIVLTSTNAASSGSFQVTLDNDGTPEGTGTATQTTAGADIQGTIDGVEATGIGNVLSLPVSAESGAAGLSIAVTASTADLAVSDGAVGTINYQQGLAQKLNSLFTQMSDSSTGDLVGAQATANTQVADLQTQIDNWTSKLADYRASLVLRFTNMETALASLKTQSTALSQYFDSSTSSSSSSSS